MSKRDLLEIIKSAYFYFCHSFAIFFEKDLNLRVSQFGLFGFYSYWGTDCKGQQTSPLLSIVQNCHYLLTSGPFLAHRLRVGQQEHIKDIIGSLKDMSAFGQKRTFSNAAL